MADHGADRAIVDGVVGAHVEERRLQDRGREHDLVHRAAVIRVHGLRRHAPLGVVDRFAQFLDIAVVAEGRGAHRVAHQVVALDAQARVIAPFVRIADLGRELGQLGARFLLGRRAHPLQVVDRLAVGDDQVLDQYFHARFALGREMLFHVQLAERFAQCAFHRGHTLLPLRTLLGHAGQRGAVEGEVLVHERLRQVRRVFAQQLPFEVGFQRRQLGLAQQFIQAGEVAWLVDDDGIELVAHAGGPKSGLPVIARRQLGQLGHGHLVVALDRVAVLDLGPLHLGQFGLEVDDRLGLGRGVLLAGQRQRVLDVLLVFGADLRQLGVVLLQVIVTVGHTQTALADIGDVPGRLAHILADVDAVRARDADLGQVGRQGRDALLVLERADARQLAGQRLVAQAFTAFGVHEAGVQVADLLGFAASLGALVLLRGLDDGQQLRRGVLAQLHERAPARAVARDLGLLQPLAVQVREEIVLRTHGGVDVLGVDARDHASRRGRGGGGGRGGRSGGGGHGRDGERCHQGQGQGAQKVSLHGKVLTCRVIAGMIRFRPGAPATCRQKIILAAGQTASRAERGFLLFDTRHTCVFAYACVGR